MPKIINDLKENILSVAREDLHTIGYSAMTIRSIAKRCNIAVGTMYNYYSSKEVLVAEIILEDWQKTIFAMQQYSEQATTITSGLHSIFHELSQFRSRYQECWNQYSSQSNGSLVVSQRHKLLCSQITSIISQLLDRLAIEPDAYLAEFTAEMLLTFSNDETFCFEQLNGILRRLYPVKEGK